MKKKVLVCLLCLVTVVGSLAGCGSKPEDKASTSESVKSDKPEEKDIMESIKDIKVKEASQEELEAFLKDEDENTLLVDARPQEAYSGWALEGAQKGGHLKGAALYSARWLDCFYSSYAPREGYLTTSMEDQDITKDKKVIVYDYSGKQAETVARYLKSQGVEEVAYCKADKLIDEGTYVESYTNHDRFVPTEIVKNISDVKTGKSDSLSEEAVEITGGNVDNVVLVDVGWGNAKESTYLSVGHVPGSIHINTDSYERPRVYVPEKRSDYAKEWRLIPLEEFRDSVCTQYGITKDSVVILSGVTIDAQGRLGFMLRSLGVKVYVMSGGLTAWMYNDYDLDKENIEIPVSVDSFGSDIIAFPDEIVWMDEVKNILAGNQEGQIIDNRSEDEYNGEKTGYNYHDLAGRIEGTLFCPQATKERGEFTQNVDATPKTRQEIEKYLVKHDVDLDKPMIFFCGDSWGAAKIAYWAQSVDINNIKEWGNGWIPWSNMGNDFIDHNGDKVHYDKYLDTVVDDKGNNKRDGVNILDDKKEETK